MESKTGFEYRSVWRTSSADPKLVGDVVDFWSSLDILPSGTDPRQRANELCAVAYRGGRLLGVSTAVVGELKQFRARLAFVRCVVAPEARRDKVALSLMTLSKDVLARWSEQNPNEHVAGMAIVVQSPQLVEHARAPLWPRTGLNLAGYTPDWNQIRVAWFEHAKVGSRSG